jgi:hypothetical protein
MQPLKTASPGRVSALRKTEQQQQQRVQQPQSPVVAPVKWSNVEVCVCVCICRVGRGVENEKRVQCVRCCSLCVMRAILFRGPRARGHERIRYG